MRLVALKPNPSTMHKVGEEFDCGAEADALIALGYARKVDESDAVEHQESVGPAESVDETEGRGEGEETAETSETFVEDTLVGLRAQYKELTGEDADGRWGEDRLRKEIAKL